MAPICMLGLSYAILKDGHVQVDILYGRFPERVQRIIQFISTVLVVVVIAILLKLSIPYVMQSYNIGEKSPDPGGLTHRWIVKSMLPLGFALLLVQSVAAMLRALIPISIPTRTGQERQRTRSDMPYTELLAILCIVSFFVLLAIGIPVALTLAVSGLCSGAIWASAPACSICCRPASTASPPTTR